MIRYLQILILAVGFGGIAACSEKETATGMVKDTDTVVEYETNQDADTGDESGVIKDSGDDGNFDVEFGEENSETDEEGIADEENDPYWKAYAECKEQLDIDSENYEEELQKCLLAKGVQSDTNS